MTWKLYAAVSAGAFVATYLVSGPPSATPERTATAKTQASQRKTPDNAADIEELAARLQARVRAETAYREPGRDPFRFVARAPAPIVTPTPVALAPLPMPAPPPAPLVTLSGIAIDRNDDGVQRFAVLSTPTAVLIVKEGESVAGLYRVISIDDEAVELEAVADNSRRTLRLAGK